MSRVLTTVVAVIFSCSVLIPLTEQIQSTHTQLLLQLRRHLEYPKQLDAWNYTDDLCYAASSSSVSVVCEGISVTKLKIVGDKIARPGRFDGHFIPDKTLSRDFSVDSFITTLTRLTNLKVVILVSLGMWGPLPDKIHRLHSLQVLDLSSNFLYGSIPQKISVMTGLQEFSLAGNYFNDTVPGWFASLSNLTVLNLQRNQLKGPLPDSFRRLSTLIELSLSSNKISGKLPDLSGLKHLEMLDLRDNRFESALPTLPNGLVTILLSNNSLTGEIPRKYGELIRLQHLDLSFNLLEGNPPAKLFSLPSISYLNLASNMLTGSLPSSISCGSQLGFVDISTNSFIGGLPSCMKSNSNKRAVKFSGNCLSLDPQNQHDAEYCNVALMDDKTSNKGTGIMVAVIVGISVIVLSILIASLIICRGNWRRDTTEQRLLEKPVPENPATGFSSQHVANARYVPQKLNLGAQVLPTYRVFSFEELKEATQNFEQPMFMGEGSTGKVYKGRLENGTFIAIRCLALYHRYSIRNLRLRLDLLSKLRHPHLVCLLGHCIDNAPNDSVDRVFLVYEYIENGNLRAHLSESASERAFTWPDRLTALIGIAKAIHFLHTGTIPGFFNNRLKTNNILLNEHLIAKVSDYGLTIITEEIYKHAVRTEEQKHVQTESPELELTNLEDDVYSFGLILLEVLMGPKLFQLGAENCRNELAKSCSSPSDQMSILDPTILASSSQESLSIVISITNKCLSKESLRPSVEDVLWNLQYAAQVLDTVDVDQKSDVASQA